MCGFCECRAAFALRAGDSWPGSARASTTSSRCGSPSSGTSRRARSRETRERTVYTLTEKGRGALAEYAGTPVAVTPLKSEPLLRLLICDLVGEEVTRESMATLREDIADLRDRLDHAERTADQPPHRATYLLLVVGFLRGLLDLHDEVVDEVERDFEAAGRPGRRAAR